MTNLGDRRRALQVRLELLHQHRLRHEADDALDHLAVLEQNHRRNARDAKLHRRLLVLVDIQLDDLELARLLSSNLLEDWGDHTTRTAPFRPEVDQDGRLAPNFRIERGVRDLCELTHCVESSLSPGFGPRLVYWYASQHLYHGVYSQPAANRAPGPNPRIAARASSTAASY